MIRFLQSFYVVKMFYDEIYAVLLALNIELVT